MNFNAPPTALTANFRPAIDLDAAEEAKAKAFVVNAAAAALFRYRTIAFWQRR